MTIQPLPRISMHVLYQSEDVRAVCEGAAQDWRLGGVNAFMDPGGVDLALARYARQPTPALLIVEALAVDEAFLESLGRLAQVCDPDTRVLVIGAANDIDSYRKLRALGVAEYLVHPFDVLDLIRVVSGLFHDKGPHLIGRTVSVIGAKGGVGASAVAHNLAYGLSQACLSETVLVDLDLAFGAVGLAFDAEPPEGVDVALAQPDRLDATLLDRLLIRHSSYLSLFTAPLDLYGAAAVDPQAYRQVILALKALAPTVVLDLPHQWSPWVRDTLVQSDEIVVVATCDLGGMRNTKSLIDYLVRARPNDPAPRLVLNQLGRGGKSDIPVKLFGEALDIKPTATVPFDAPLFAGAMVKCKPLAELNRKAEATLRLQGLVQAVAGLTAPPPRPPSPAAAFLQVLRKSAPTHVWKTPQ